MLQRTKLLLIAVLVPVSCFGFHGTAAARFIRGDVNDDKLTDVTDGVALLSVLFLGRKVGCKDAVDFDDNGKLEVTDVVNLLGFLFLSSSTPAQPYPGCGDDPTRDNLDCESSTSCAEPESSSPRNWVPAGSEIVEESSSEIVVRVPEGYVVVSPGGTVGAQLSQRCTCASGEGGCSPVFQGGGSGCVTEDCSECNGKRSGIVLENSGIDFASQEATSDRPHLTPEILALPRIRNELQQFVSDLYDGAPPPQPRRVSGAVVSPPGYVFTLVSVYGYLGTVLVTEEMVADFGLTLHAKKLTCTCHAGSGCEEKNGPPLSGVVYCEAGSCTDCEGELKDNVIAGEPGVVFGF